MGNNFGQKNSNWRGGKHTFVCECCGKEFKKYLCGRQTVRFCSNKCAHEYMPVQNKGKHLSVEHRHKLRLAKLGTKLTEEHKKKLSLSNTEAWSKMSDKTRRERSKKLRESTIRYVELSCNGNFIPRLGVYEKQILDRMEEILGYNILRQYKINGYFLDGYCPMMNLAIEIDEQYHNSKLRKQKDRNRESEIIGVLGCQFLRIPYGGEIK